MTHDTGRSRFAPDFTADDIQNAAEIITNGVWVPASGIQLSRMSRLSVNDTGPKGELVSVTPIALSYKAASFTPGESGSKIITDRINSGKPSNDAYCFTVSTDADTLEHTSHNALVRISEIMVSGYASPLFYRRKNLNSLKRSGSQSLESGNNKDKPGYGLLSNPLASSIAFIPAAQRIDKSESQIYISYTKSGDALLHLDGKNEKITAKPFLLSETLSALMISKDKTALDKFAADIIEIMPELFGQSWNSRKIKHIIESVLMEHLDENEIPGNSSIQKTADHLPPAEKIIIAEKILKYHLGIALYFIVSYRN